MYYVGTKIEIKILVLALKNKQIFKIVSSFYKGKNDKSFIFRTAGRICAVGTATARGTTFSVLTAK